MPAILVVDDDDDVREALVDILRDEGYEVLEAINGKRALDVLEAMVERPGLIITDLTMPEMNGAELLIALTQVTNIAALPILVCSADDRPGDLPEVARYIRKPPTLAALLELVHELCGPP